MARIACFGELLLRLGAPGRELLLQRPRLDVHVGGAEANVAVALARLGEQAAMISRVPDNVLGEAAIGHLRRYGVDVTGVTTGTGRMGLYFLSPAAGVRPADILYDRDGSSFAAAGTADYDWEHLLAGADRLHLSGITPALGAGPAEAARAAVEAAAARSIPISFDGNYRASLWARRGGDARAVLAPFAEKADILFGNHRDIGLLLGRGFEGDGEPRRRAAAEIAFEAFPGLRLIASTARHVVDAGTHRLSARIDTRDGSAQTDEVTVSGIVDRIGSGDAFAAGVLHGLVREEGLEPAVQAGLALACLKHGLSGDASLFDAQAIAQFRSGRGDVRR